MDSDIEELESLFSEHFGKTPISTPFASQASDSEDNEAVHDDGIIGENDLQLNVDERARHFLTTVSEERADSDSDDEREHDPQDDNVMLEGDQDVQRIRQFMFTGCGCHNNCHTHFKERDIYKHVLDVREMEKSDKEMYIMATLVDNSDNESTKRGKKRQRVRYEYFFLGKHVCKNTFKLVFDIGKHSLQNIMTHISKHGATPRTHANTGRKPAKSLKFDDIKLVVQFISNYADEFGMPQPAAPRGRDNIPPIYLPSDTTKKCVHEKYVAGCIEKSPECRSVKYTTFCNVWNTCLSHVKIATPRDDVCASCEKMRKAIMDSVTEEEKLESTNKMKEHILQAQKEREVYNTCIKLAKQAHGISEAEQYVHYTFDFSQNVCLPHHARQMGPLYFTTLRKIQIFGFRLDGVPRQLNFLIDENETIGKDGTSTHGANSVISMIDWALPSHGSGETTCTIHADNCPGQNKNQYVLGYFMWRVMTGKHQRIEYMMQVPGHARCLVDSGFASLKKLYRRTDCDTIGQLEEVVNKSSSTNVAVRYPSWQWRDWKSFLGPVFNPLRGITYSLPKHYTQQYQYFMMSSAEPGVVKVKKAFDADETSLNLLKSRDFTFEEDAMPDSIAPEGLSRERQDYFHRVVRPFVRPAYQDITCPAPIKKL